MAKRQAQDAMPEARQKYVEAVLSNAVYLFPVGERAAVQKFAELVAAESVKFVANAVACYDRLAERVEDGIVTTRQFGMDQVLMINRIVGEDWALPESVLRELVVVRDRDALVAHLRDLFRSVYGDAMAVADVVGQLVDQALAGGFADKTFVAVVTESDQRFRDSLCTKSEKARTSVVELSSVEEVTKDLVLKTFKAVPKKA
jgi:hypothetical protein